MARYEYRHIAGWSGVDHLAADLLTRVEAPVSKRHGEAALRRAWASMGVRAMMPRIDIVRIDRKAK